VSVQPYLNHRQPGKTVHPTNDNPPLRKLSQDKKLTRPLFFVTNESGTKTAGTNSPEFINNLILVFRANNTVPDRHHGEITPGKDLTTNTKLNKEKG